MSLVSVVAWGLVASSPGAPAAETAVPEGAAPVTLAPAAVAPAPADLLRFDELPAPQPPSEDDPRVRRFLGALAGGAVGFAAPLALLPLGDNPCGFAGFCPALSGGQFALLSVVPVTSALGAWLGFVLAGGDAGPLSAFASLLPGAFVGVAMFALATATQQGETVRALLPFLLTTGAVTVVAGALALDARGRQLVGLGGAKRWGEAPPARPLLTSLVTAVGGAVGVFGTAAAASLCRDVGCAFVAGGLGATALVGTALTAWGVHRALGGRGSALSAVLGLGVVAAGALAGLPFVLTATNGFPDNVLTGPAAGVMALQFAVGAAVLFPTLALEWSHADAIAALAASVQVSAAPLPGGGTVAASLRF